MAGLDSNLKHALAGSKTREEVWGSVKTNVLLNLNQILIYNLVF